MKDIQSSVVWKCIKDYGNVYVESETHKRHYLVEIHPEDLHTCECPDFIFRGKPSNTPCKHIARALRHTCQWQGDKADTCPECGGEVEKIEVYK